MESKIAILMESGVKVCEAFVLLNIFLVLHEKSLRYEIYKKHPYLTDKKTFIPKFLQLMYKIEKIFLRKYKIAKSNYLSP